MYEYEAIRLRKALDFFYEREGSRTEILITLPKGGYVPEFTRRYDPSERNEVEELIAKGTYLLYKAAEKPLLDACSLFERVLRADPENVRAHNALIPAHCMATGIEYVPPSATTPKIAGLAHAVRVLDDRNSDTHVSDMIANGFCHRDLPAAIAAGRRALELGPNNAMAISGRAESSTLWVGGMRRCFMRTEQFASNPICSICARR